MGLHAALDPQVEPFLLLQIQGWKRKVKGFERPTWGDKARRVSDFFKITSYNPLL